MKPSKKLAFFGSGPVGAATLKALIAAGFEFEAVITKPKPAHHRGDFPVIEVARVQKLPLFTPANAAELTDLFKQQSFKSSAGLVVDYGLIIPKKIIDKFKLGIINSHFSLLPQWRGADPITFALLSGQKETGVSIMLIEASLDTGPLVAQATYHISPDETIISLTDSLVELSNKTLVEVLPLYLDGKIKTFKQDESQEPCYSRKLKKEDGLIDWSKPAEQIEREVRAYLGWPRSRAKLFSHEAIVIKARVAESQSDGDLVIKCQPGYLEIEELIAPSGRKMSGADFLRGYKKS